MTKFDRLKAAINGEKVDRPPFSMWMHFHMADRNPFTLAEATNNLFEKYGMDLVKITPTGLFMVQDYGASIKFGQEEWQHPLQLDNLLKTPEDLLNLRELDINTGALRRELDQVSLTVKKIGGRSPVIMTVFSPLTVVCKMLGNANIPAFLQYYIENYPDALHSALKKISKMINAFIDGCIERGVDGFFFATQAANFQTMRTADQFKEFGAEYDFPLTQKIHDAGKICLLHVCMHKVMLNEVKNYPVDIINWDNIYSGTSLTEAREIIPDKLLAGGIDIFKINTYKKEEVDEMIARAIDEAGKLRFMLAPTCVLLASTPHENLLEISNYMNNLA